MLKLTVDESELYPAKEDKSDNFVQDTSAE
jgi:hypothetical protein